MSITYGMHLPPKRWTCGTKRDSRCVVRHIRTGGVAFGLACHSTTGVIRLMFSHGASRCCCREVLSVLARKGTFSTGDISSINRQSATEKAALQVIQYELRGTHRQCDRRDAAT